MSCSTEGEYDATETVDVTGIAEYTDSSGQFSGPSVPHTSPVDYGIRSYLKNNVWKNEKITYTSKLKISNRIKT